MGFFTSSSIRSAIVWMPFTWVVMYGSNATTPKVRCQSSPQWHDRKMWACGRGELAWYGYVCMLACVYGTYLIVGLNCYRVAWYGSICVGTHIWKYLDLHSAYFIMGLGLKWNSYAGALTMKRVARLVTLYMRECMYATVSTVRNKFS